MRALIAVFALIGAAHAQVCVALDTNKDTLSKRDQASAKMLVESAFESQGVTIVPPPCSALYTVSNVRLGEAVIARIQGPDRAVKAKAASIGELDAVYDQLVRQLMGKGSKTTRHNVTTAQARPRREKADSIWMLNIGTGYLGGADLDSIPVLLGAGYRYELDHFGIEAGTRLFLATGNSDDHDGGGGFGVRVMALYHFNGTAAASPYVGGGLGFGITGAQFDDESYTGSGLEGHIAVGYSFLRASTIRMFVQLDAALPFYELEETTLLEDAGLEPRYVPIIGLSLGVGWNR